MNYVQFGKSGLKVSPLCLGCMSFGEAARGGHGWVLDEEASEPFFRQAIESGINFFDTANVYSNGSSEEITGRALKKFANRDEVVVATKVCGPMGKGPNQTGLSRKAILQEVDNSLRRLGMDYIDLYQIHRLDPLTPMEEILEALHDVVKAGKVRYIGASSMYAWQFGKMLQLADKHGWTRFVSMQNHLNLLYREEEREMLPLCIEEGVAVIPWSPLARGRLTRPWDEKTERSENDQFGEMLYARTAEADHAVVDMVGAVAAERNLPRAQIALAWLLAKPGVTAPIIGATKTAHLDDAIAALSVKLSDDEIARLESGYVPHPVLGHQ
jgi:aryl-alcohol dehydrogenase-like predicted oxidoreductase